MHRPRFSTTLQLIGVFESVKLMASPNLSGGEEQRTAPAYRTGKLAFRRLELISES